MEKKKLYWIRTWLKKISLPSFSFLLATLSILLSTACLASSLASSYNVHNLVSDGAFPADHIDPDLINPWGLAFGVTNPVWIANQGTGTSTIYNGLGVKLPLTVTIPPANGGTGSPTGMVFNNTNNFVVSANDKSAPSVFIFATEDGTISAWAPSVDPNNAILMVKSDPARKTADYKGLTRAANGTDGLLLAANFFTGQIDVFDKAFNPVEMPDGAFTDPFLPEGYAPFNVQNINGAIFVCYAKQDEAKEDAVLGPGLGVVDVYDVNGHFINRVATGGNLNAPWGITLAPANFGSYSNHLLIGNFGDGKINVYSPVTYSFVGQLSNAAGAPITIDGLWSLGFGNGYNNQPTDTLYFTAGPNDETHGIYGKIELQH